MQSRCNFKKTKLVVDEGLALDSRKWFLQARLLSKEGIFLNSFILLAYQHVSLENKGPRAPLGV
jgi:hypothetical protein